MKLIGKLDQLLKNIETVESYLTSDDENDRKEISKYIKRGTCFVAYQIEKEIRFAPSKFLGYVDNTLSKHIPSKTDGRDTNKAIIDILSEAPIYSDELEEKYFKYCENLGLLPSENGAYGARRKFWALKLTKDFADNNLESGEFPEGKIIERIHKARERNSKVVQIAKENFKKKYKKLFCQICLFDFEKVYGELGRDFIEGHHTIAVSEMKSDHKTKPEDIAILCSNCHKMVHKRRPWLTMNELQNIIK